MVFDLIVLFICMLIIAGLVFVPLGYFIYMYTMKQGEPFGDIEPHGDSDSLVLDLAEQAIDKVKSYIIKK
ncbi:MAG: hypothetical protein HFP81_04375 [Methylococcales symbiont of Hymedesmia sp. n. MRB-2018]|nr:MAG: hypothetical protein HFP78_06185 [Methylococcales symbiont of Hymedesmia sp. n. MRB-2018]KAF3984030.1 MAG: hypothetical protein HFP81_04375 [Methylococcales symbiont of Hymedesmia sp. n. MRB-2018]